MIKYNERFKVMLKYYLNKLGLKDLKNVSVLDVACGRCNEAEVLLELFGKVRGVDSNSNKIKRIKKKGFRVGDARDLRSIFKEKFDLLIVRHPNIFGDELKKIYRECFKVSCEGGVLISSFYSEREFLLGKSLIKGAGYEIKFLGQNKFYLNRFGFDRYFVVGGKVKRGWFRWLFG